MKHSVCIICMLFLGGIAAAQSKVVTNFDSILVDSNHMAIVKSEVITVVFANGTDSGVAHTKTVYVNDQEILVPHELTNTDAVNLVTGKVNEVIYHDTYWGTDLSFWEQLMQPWSMSIKSDSRRYVLAQDSNGFFVPGPEEFTTKTPGTNWLTIALMVISMWLLFDIIIFREPYNSFPGIEGDNHIVFVLRLLLYILFAISIIFLIIMLIPFLFLIVAQGSIMEFREFFLLTVPPALWYAVLLGIIVFIKAKLNKQPWQRRIKDID